jgi:hypothetical protein
MSQMLSVALTQQPACIPAVKAKPKKRGTQQYATGSQMVTPSLAMTFIKHQHALSLKKHKLNI